ncbi:MAG TPA: alkaline phosphatase D family protein [Solirubrobacteraceae bacterium]|nr:alkaline phosphatase D family protein [Solirubrobacteraceae bacterium]
MSGLTRRRLLQLAAAVVAAAQPAGEALAAVRRRRRRPRPSFRHGVASGDPLADRVILWTRVSGVTGPLRVGWIVASDPALRKVVRRGTARTGPRRDYTVKVDATGLQPGRTYHYGFVARGRRSPVGRTRTLPTGAVDSLTLVVATCGDWSRGLFNSYGRIADRDDVDAVVHLGDYIYETPKRDDRVRAHDPPVALRRLSDYRGRYASYRSDPNLQAMHRRHPLIWVWDDHETVDGTWRGGADPADHNDARDGPFAVRKAAALQAALEWLPIRSPDRRRPERIYRDFAFGDLVDLVMLDTRRIGRDRQGEGNVEAEYFRQTGEFADPDRQILGAEQEAWLIDRLARSTATWRLLGNQVVFSPIKVVGAPEATGMSVYANPDQWDGYAPARRRVLDAMERDGVQDVVVLTGDVHASMAFEVTEDPNNAAAYDPVSGRGARAVELVTPSISSASDPQEPQDAEGVVERLLLENAEALRVPNPHMKYAEAVRNGYLLVQVNRERVRAEYWLVPTVTRPTDEEERSQVFEIARGTPRLAPAD